MGMSTSVSGFKPPDEKWKKMKAVWDSCKAAGVDPPKNVQEFFGFEEPDDNGVEVSRKELEACGAIRKWSGDMREGFEVLVDKLPSDVKIIRFYNSW